MRGETEHQRRRKRPGLRAVVADLVDFDIGFFRHLATNRIFETLTGLDETGDRGVAALGPARLPTEQAMFVMRYENDDRGIDPWEDLRGALLVAADPRVAARLDQGR